MNWSDMLLQTSFCCCLISTLTAGLSYFFMNRIHMLFQGSIWCISFIANITQMDIYSWTTNIHFWWNKIYLLNSISWNIGLFSYNQPKWKSSTTCLLHDWVGYFSCLGEDSVTPECCSRRCLLCGGGEMFNVSTSPASGPAEGCSSFIIFLKIKYCFIAIIKFPKIRYVWNQDRLEYIFF